MDEGRIALCHLGSIAIFSHGLMITCPLAQPAYSFLVQAFEGILHREGGTDDGKHDVVAGWEWIDCSSRRINTTVCLPELADIAEVRVAGGKMIALKVGLRLVAPYDVPLGIGIESIHLGARVVGNARGLSWITPSLGSGAEEKFDRTAV